MARPQPLRALRRLSAVGAHVVPPAAAARHPHPQPLPRPRSASTAASTAAYVAADPADPNAYKPAVCEALTADESWAGEPFWMVNFMQPKGGPDGERQ